MLFENEVDRITYMSWKIRLYDWDWNSLMKVKDSEALDARGFFFFVFERVYLMRRGHTP